MTGFVSTVPPPAAPSTRAVIEHDGWYPPIDLGALREAMRVPDVVTDARLTEAVKVGMMSVARELRIWKVARVAAGDASLDAVDVGGREIDFESELVVCYRRAVYGFAAAELAETHRDITATGAGADRAQEMALTADDHRRNATHAVRDILGVTRTAVELL